MRNRQDDDLCWNNGDKRNAYVWFWKDLTPKQLKSTWNYQTDRMRTLAFPPAFRWFYDRDRSLPDAASLTPEKPSDDRFLLPIIYAPEAPQTTIDPELDVPIDAEIRVRNSRVFAYSVECSANLAVFESAENGWTKVEPGTMRPVADETSTRKFYVKAIGNEPPAEPIEPIQRESYPFSLPHSDKTIPIDAPAPRNYVKLTVWRQSKPGDETTQVRYAAAEIAFAIQDAGAK